MVVQFMHYGKEGSAGASTPERQERGEEQCPEQASAYLFEQRVPPAFIQIPLIEQFANAHFKRRVVTSDLRETPVQVRDFSLHINSHRHRSQRV